jgi:hypothetical protein
MNDTLDTVAEVGGVKGGRRRHQQQRQQPSAGRRHWQSPSGPSAAAAAAAAASRARLLLKSTTLPPPLPQPPQHFNAIRMPFSAELALDMDGKVPGNINYAANPELKGLTTGQVMDRWGWGWGWLGARPVHSRGLPSTREGRG